ncbi:MAG: hypothetical protein IJ525_00815 [Alphaproteobacteria bacterium]|nr:hypothetical protein [Alphaproteobacteria bacterium]
MEKEVMIAKTKDLCWKVINNVLIMLVIFMLLAIIELHKTVPFFPILFLFNLCFWLGHPLYLKYILRQKWFECTKDDYLCLKYLVLPKLIMEILLMLYYHNETMFIIEAIMESNDWK